MIKKILPTKDDIHFLRNRVADSIRVHNKHSFDRLLEELRHTKDYERILKEFVKYPTYGKKCELEFLRYYLYELFTGRSKFRNAFVNVALNHDLTRSMKMWKLLLNPNSGVGNRSYSYEIKDEKGKNDKHYAYIPSQPSQFLQLIAHNKIFGKKHFIDVGCGSFSKPILAEMFGNFESVSGIEYTESTYKLGQRLGKDLYGAKYDKETRKSVIKGPVEIIHGDAIEFDFSSYDFIYMYVPIAGPKLEELYRNILETAPSQAIIVDIAWGFIIKNILKEEYNTKCNRLPRFLRKKRSDAKEKFEVIGHSLSSKESIDILREFQNEKLYKDNKETSCIRNSLLFRSFTNNCI